MKTLFPQIIWRPVLKCPAKSNYWGDADADYTQIIGGDTVKLLGGYISPSPLPGFDTPVGEKMKQRQTNVEETDLWETIIRVEAQNKA